MTGNTRSPLLRVSVVRVGSSAVLRLEGELDVASAGYLNDVLTQLERGDGPPPDRIIIDAEQLSFVDAAGLSPLIRAHRRLPPGSLRLRNVRAPVLRVLRLLDLATVFGVEG